MKRKKIKKHSTKSSRLNVRFCSVLAVSLASVLLLSSWVSEGGKPQNQDNKTVSDNEVVSEISSEAQSDDNQVQQESETQAIETQEAEQPQDTAEEFTWNEEPCSITMYLTDNCRRRVEPTTDSDSYGIIEAGSAVLVTAKTDVGFYKVEEGGYIWSEYLTEEAPKFTWNESACSKTMYLTSNCNKRTEPTTDSDSAGIIKAGSAVKVVATTDAGFSKIEDGTYICDEFLTETAPVQQATVQASTNTTTATTIDASSIRSLLNTAPLSPRSTGYAVVDQKISAVFSRIFTSGMDTYSKVKACYDYLILNTSYGSSSYPTAGFGSMPEGSDAYIAWSTMCCLENHVATCNKYSSAFISMMRTLGFDARYVDGQCTAAGGGYTGHVWVEVYIGGVAYVFDPQVEDNLTSGSNIQYLRFCKTYAQVPGKYVK